MNTIEDRLEEFLAALVRAFPIEDVWLLEAGKAKECALERPTNFIVIVPDGSDAHVIERAAADLILKRPEWSGIDVFVFPLSTITRTPRPLLVKMALTSGANIYCK
ncbi:MAG TPA: hypothetical protein VIT00_15775 [Terrimicrobiaceae bacterium]